MTGQKEWFCEYNVTPIRKVFLGDDRVHQAVGEGNINIRKYVNSVHYSGKLDKEIYIPGCKKNLYSLNVSTAREVRVIFDEDKVDL